MFEQYMLDVKDAMKRKQRVNKLKKINKYAKKNKLYKLFWWKRFSI